MTNAPKSDPELRAGPQLLQLLEAALFVGSEPLSAERFQQAFPEISASAFERGIRELGRRYREQHRPYEIRKHDAGYRIELHEPFRAELHTHLRSDRGIKLPRTVIEVLSAVAYRQPISRPELEELLRTDVGPVLRQLVRRQLIQLAPRDESSDDPDRYITTPRFLELFGLESLDDLPAMEDLQ